MNNKEETVIIKKIKKEIQKPIKINIKELEVKKNGQYKNK